MKKKIAWVHLLRFIIQSLFFLWLPGLFSLIFSEIKQIYALFYSDQVNFMQLLPHLGEMLAVFILTVLLGRFFCGWFCAFGFVNDLVYKVAQKTFQPKILINERLDSGLKHLKYLVLIAIVFLAWSRGMALDDYNPWNAFAQMSGFSLSLSQFTPGLLILAFILTGGAFIERFFCRYLCPLGAVFSLLSRIRLFNITKPSLNCGECRLCTSSCAMGIRLYAMDRVAGGECINCLKCLEACPRHNPQASLGSIRLKPAEAGTLACLAFVLMYSVSGIYTGTSDSKDVKALTTDSYNVNYDNNVDSLHASQNTLNQGQQKYKDGTYTGTGRGFKPGLQVEVTIKANKINRVEIISQNETPRYCEYALQKVPQEIIKAQSTKVDTVSGATRTSEGVIEAVNDALSKAIIS